MENDQKTPAAPPTDAIQLMPVPGLAGLRVVGADAFTFLQGQATCDLRRIDPTRSGLGAFCNPQGRVVATFRILAREDGYLLLLAADLAEAVARRLRMYVLRAKVEIQVAAIGLAGIAGPAAVRIHPLPEETDAVTRIEDLEWIRVLDRDPRWLVVGEPRRIEATWRELESRPEVVVADDTAWSLGEIRSGVPTIQTATSEKFLPQMLNLDRVGGVSFDKGCYTGQEVIARAQFRGQVKRRMYRLAGPLPRTPAPGDSLVDRGEGVGRVIEAAPAGAMRELLAVVRCDRAHSSTIRLGTDPAIPLHWLDLGYTLP